MSTYLLWILLSALTGNPILAGVVVLLVLFSMDRFTLRLFPDPVNWVRRWWRAGRLERRLASLPHDRTARRELAELLIRRGKYPRAVEVLRPNLEAGDEDTATLFAMGVACLGANHSAQGEKLLAHLEELQPNFRVGEVHLVLGRDFLRRREFAKARQALELLVTARTGTVEGRVLLAQALQGLGDDGAAALMKERAWAEYVAAPKFVRRKERRWAWRARPARPATYGLIVLLALVLLATWALPLLRSTVGPPYEP